MGYHKDVYIEACEELESVLYYCDSDQIARVEAFLKGEVENARGILNLSTEALILDSLEMFLEAWERSKSDIALMAGEPWVAIA
jgi:hypothetical protein